MAFSRLIGLMLISSSSLLASLYPDNVSGQMLYQLYHGEVTSAFQLYLDHAKEVNEHDFHLLQQAGIQLLEQGINSGDAEIQLMCMFGAGIAASSDLLPILEKGIRSKEMRTQIIALNYLGKLQDDEADIHLLHALSSPFLLTRLEACLQLARKNHPSTLTQLQSLLVKVPPPVRPLFAQIAIYLDGAEGQAFMRQLLSDSDIDVRVETILAIAKEGRDDFLPQIRNLATQTHHAEQESCAFALGELKDQESFGRLKEWTKSQRSTVRLAAAMALLELGETQSLALIEEEAKKANLFAINALGKLKEGKEVLLPLLAHSDRDVRINAAASLAQMGDSSGLSILKDILIPGGRDLGVARLSSPGRGLNAWRVVPSASHNTKVHPGLMQSTLAFREALLVLSLEFAEDDFLTLAHLILDQKQDDLLPLLIQLLQNRRSEKTLKLLKDGHQKTGSPFVRNYCTLALYRMEEKGPYEEQLINWVGAAAHTAMIRFREEEEESKNGLSPESSSRFLVEAFEALAQAQKETALVALIKAMAYGNPKNRYALAGLLIKTTE